MLAHIRDIVRQAQRGGYAIPAFNTSNMETTLGLIAAAVAARAPIIIQISESTIRYAGLRTIVELIRTAIDEHSGRVPIALHLDHGKSLAVVQACLAAGLTSVHMDGSERSFRENVAVTAKAVRAGHRAGAWVQGELGSLFGHEGMTMAEVPDDLSAHLTDPAAVPEFVARTELDTLAVSVGTLHGLFRGRERLDAARVRAIREAAPKLPLVLHGGSGLPSAALRRGIRSGITIVNIDTELREAFTLTLQRTLRRRLTKYDPREILMPARQAVTRAALRKIKILGATGRASV